MIATVRLASPWWLLALALLAWLAWRRGRHGRPAALVFSCTGLLRQAAQAGGSGPGQWLATLRAAGLVLIVLALARPQIEKAVTREDARGINLMLALDFSGTMRTRDFFLDGRRVSRTQGLRQISAEFIRARTNDRIGLVTFDREACLLSPLTLDHEWLLQTLRHETNGVGTAIGPALVVAATHLQRHTNETRVLVLMTDAENVTDWPAPDAVAEALRPLGVRVHCIQVLSPDQSNPRGDLGEMLAGAAMRTGGSFFRVRGGPDLRAVYAAIDKLEKQKLSERKQKGWRELFVWLAWPALGLLCVEQLLGHTRWRRLP